MVVLPKTKEIDESIYNFLEQFNNYPDVMLDTDFAYYPDEYLITYAFVISRKHNEWFAEYLRDVKNFQYWDADMWLLSFFHELGHFFTIKNFSKKELRQYYQQKEISADDKDAYFKYFSNPIEDAATSWAIDFINTHDVEIEEWWNKDLVPKINKYFIKCGLEDD